MLLMRLVTARRFDRYGFGSCIVMLQDTPRSSRVPFKAKVNVAKAISHVARTEAIDLERASRIETRNA